ncbi:cell killing protein [Escherichia coli]|nr:cell killing protein [Escherichia coli]
MKLPLSPLVWCVLIVFLTLLKLHYLNPKRLVEIL